MVRDGDPLCIMRLQITKRHALNRLFQESWSVCKKWLTFIARCWISANCACSGLRIHLAQSSNFLLTGTIENPWQVPLNLRVMASNALSSKILPEPRSSVQDDPTFSILSEIRATLQSIRQDFAALSAVVETINGRVNNLSGVKEVQDAAGFEPRPCQSATVKTSPLSDEANATASSVHPIATSDFPKDNNKSLTASSLGVPPRPNLSSRIILTTYPGQSGIDPLTMNWGDKDPSRRGPVVVSRGQSTLRRRNGKTLRSMIHVLHWQFWYLAIGAHGGSYSIYHALAVASKNLDVEHRPDFTNTEPAANIGPFPQWTDPQKIVSMDPLGHLAPWLFRDVMREEDVDIRPTIAITKAHMKLPELEQSVRSGRLVPDGTICINETGELAVTKIAVEPVWYLPGVAKRFGIGNTCSRLVCLSQLTTARWGHIKKISIWKYRRFIPRIDYQSWYQSISSTDWRTHCILLWWSCKDVW